MFHTTSAFLLVIGAAVVAGHSIFKRETDKCECVPYYQCEDGKIITTGEGLLDPRIKTCSGVDVCCEIPDEDGEHPKPSTDRFPIDPTDPPTPSPPIDPVDPIDPEYPIDPIVPPEPTYPTEGPGHGEHPVKPGHQSYDYRIPEVTKGHGCGRRRLPPKSNLGDDAFRITPSADAEQTFYGEEPWMARIHTSSPGADKKEFLCGGTLVTPSVVMTAAHCVVDLVKDHLFIRVGEWNTESTEEPIHPQDRKIKRIIMHPDFNPKSLVNDVALLGLESPVKLSETVDVICTPESGSHIDTKNCMAIGWGQTVLRDTSLPHILRKVRLPVITREECMTRMRASKLGKHFSLRPGFLCAGGESDSDTCKGDGGGPLICPLKAEPNRFVQAGIISWGVECGQGYPSVFASVEHYMPWIKSQIE